VQFLVQVPIGRFGVLITALLGGLSLARAIAAIIIGEDRIAVGAHQLQGLPRLPDIFRVAVAAQQREPGVAVREVNS
jgi:hypothetical protein